jgi:putative membrane protein
VIRNITLAAIIALPVSAYAQNVASSNAVSLGDEYFLMKAYAEGIAEVAKSQVAVQRATQPDIRTFAERMVRDHTECDNKIVELCRRKGIALPAAIDAVSTAAINRLARMSGSDFDKAYMCAQECAHKAAILMFEHESCKGEDAEIKDFATNTLSTLQGHAKSAFELAGDKADYEKFCKIQDFAKKVMDEKGDKRDRDEKPNK